MAQKSLYAKSEAYQLFRSWVALQQMSIGTLTEKVWKYYDFGPKEATPLVCLPGASGTADIFFRQIISLCPKGYRIIAVQFDAFDTHLAWCKSFDRFLDKLSVNKVHLFGTSLGGYLAQCFAQFRPARVESMILNNTFCDTQYFHDNAPCAPMFSLMPEFMLKRIILGNFPTATLEAEVANSVDFMVEQLELLTQSELAGRLTLNCTLGPLKPGTVTLGQEHITIIDALDDVVLPENIREEVYKFYPHARVAHLKSGGNFPYLSRADEVNVHIQVHLRRHGLPVIVDPALASESSSRNIASAGKSGFFDLSKSVSSSSFFPPRFSSSPLSAPRSQSQQQVNGASSPLATSNTIANTNHNNNNNNASNNNNSNNNNNTTTTATTTTTTNNSNGNSYDNAEVNGKANNTASDVLIGSDISITTPHKQVVDLFGPDPVEPLQDDTNKPLLE